MKVTHAVFQPFGDTENAPGYPDTTAWGTIGFRAGLYVPGSTSGWVG